MACGRIDPSTAVDLGILALDIEEVVAGKREVVDGVSEPWKVGRTVNEVHHREGTDNDLPPDRVVERGAGVERETGTIRGEVEHARLEPRQFES